MSDIVYLRCNNEQVMLNDLLTGDGRVFESFVFQPGSIWFDNQGIIRQFSVRYPSGRTGNYFLMPNVPNQEKHVRMILKDLGEFGVKMVGNALFGGGALILDLAHFLFEKYGRVALSDLIDRQKQVPLAYIAIDNQEVVFHGVIHIAEGVGLSELIFYVKNPYAQPIFFQTSRELQHWRQDTIQPGQTLEIYFGNRQQDGYIRLFTCQRPGLTYQIQARKTYTVFWNEHRQFWDLIENN